MKKGDIGLALMSCGFGLGIGALGTLLFGGLSLATGMIAGLFTGTAVFAAVAITMMIVGAVFIYRDEVPPQTP